MSATVTPCPLHAARPAQVGFEREELQRILDLYGRMVAAGEWRDYAIDFRPGMAIFSIFRHTSEQPLFAIAKVPNVVVAVPEYTGGMTARAGPRRRQGATIMSSSAAVPPGGWLPIYLPNAGRANKCKSR